MDDSDEHASLPADSDKHIFSFCAEIFSSKLPKPDACRNKQKATLKFTLHVW